MCYLFPLLVINAGRDIILIMRGPIRACARRRGASISFVFHTVILIHRDIKRGELQRSPGVLVFFVSNCVCPPPDESSRRAAVQSD